MIGLTLEQLRAVYRIRKPAYIWFCPICRRWSTTLMGVIQHSRSTHGYGLKYWPGIEEEQAKQEDAHRTERAGHEAAFGVGSYR